MKTKLTINAIVFFIALVLLLIATKGDATDNRIRFQESRRSSIGSPFELSNSTARFALTEAIVKDRSFFLNEALAKFSAPDLVDFNGKFISIFTPGVSLIGVPFYILGQFLGLKQLGTFFPIVLASFLNTFLVSLVAQKLGASKKAGGLSGIIFLFGTNALSYSQTFTQHPLSITVILLGLIAVNSRVNAKNNFLLGLLYGISALIDIPNLIILTPVLIYATIKNFSTDSYLNKITVLINPSIVTLVFGFLPAVIIFALYNYATTGSYTTLAQNIGRSIMFRETLPIQSPAEVQESIEMVPSTYPEIELIHVPFNTRLMLNGLHILLASNERSWLFFSPIVLLGLIGFWLAFKQKTNNSFVTVTISVVLINVLLYSMFADPWGGWAFGPRYLLPSAAILCAGLGLLIDQYSNKRLFNIIFVSILVYSVYISTLGVMTSQAIPPRGEAIRLSTYIPYTYKLNIDKVNNNLSSNLLYNLLFKNRNLPFKYFVFGYAFAVSALIITYYFYSAKQKRD